MEYWDMYDRDRKRLGIRIRRGEEIRPGHYHLVVHVAIFNSKGQLLIQKRSRKKESFPSMWDLTAAGSSLAGENSRQAGEREVREELGLEIDLGQERPFFTINFPQGFDDFYLIERELDLGDLVLQEEEVEAVKWADEREVKEMISQGEFINYYFMDRFFEIRKNMGAYNSSEYRNEKR